MNSICAGAFPDPTLDFETRAARGATPQGVGDAGLVSATLSRTTHGDRTSWFDDRVVKVVLNTIGNVLGFTANVLGPVTA